jgi:hypothetical protein
MVVEEMIYGPIPLNEGLRDPNAGIEDMLSKGTGAGTEKILTPSVVDTHISFKRTP